MNRLASPYQKLIKFSAYLAPFVLLLIRLAWGWELMHAGYNHLATAESRAFTEKNFIEWGVPMAHANVWISGITEMVGGALWIAGLGTRLISVVTFFNFCVAYATAHVDTVRSLFKGSPDDFIDALAFHLLVASLLLIAFGPGLFSLDAIIKKLTFSKKVASPE